MNKDLIIGSIKENVTAIQYYTRIMHPPCVQYVRILCQIGEVDLVLSIVFYSFME